MPRQYGTDRRHAGRADRTERTLVFGKTKLCKFHILGVCSKGVECNFAHDAAELNQPPDLAKTKVCKMLINTGRCDDPDCRYAHNSDEIREMPTADLQLPPTHHAPRREASEWSRAAAPRQEGPSPSAAPAAPPVMPNFATAFGQPFGLPGVGGGQPHDPQAQAMVLQQLAAQLSMQAAMIQAAHSGGWPGQQPAGGQPSSSPAAQWLAAGPQAPQDAARHPKAVPVELAALTHTQPHAAPAFVGGQEYVERRRGGRGGGDRGDAPPQGKTHQRRIQNGRVHASPQHLPSGGAGWPPRQQLPAPPASGPPGGLTAASMASPLMLPTNFEQDPPSLLLGSLFDSPKSRRGSSPKHPASPAFSLSCSEAPPLFALSETEVTVKTAEEGTFAKFALEAFSPRDPYLSSEAASVGPGRGRLSSHEGEKRLQDTPVLGGIMVKHTFLDIQPEGPKAGMRSVQTHSGSLCLMAGQDEDDDDIGFSQRVSPRQ